MQMKKNRLFHSEDTKTPAGIRLEVMQCPPLLICFCSHAFIIMNSELLLVGLCKEREDARSEGSSYKNKVKTYKRFLRTIHSSPALPTLQ